MNFSPTPYYRKIIVILILIWGGIFSLLLIKNEAVIATFYVNIFVGIIFSTFLFVIISLSVKKTDKIEKELALNEMRMKKAFQLLQIGNWEWDFRNNSLFLSPQAYDVLHIDNSITDMFKIRELLQIENEEKLIENFRHAIKQRKTEFEYFITVKLPTGESSFIRSTVDVEYDSTYKPIKIIGTLFDFTKQKKLDQHLRRLQIAVEEGANTVVITDKFGNIEYVNHKFQEVSGYFIEEVLGKNPRILKSGFQSTEVYSKMWKTLSQGEIWRGELCNKRKDGTLFWEIASIVPIKDENDSIINYVAIKEDITSLKSAQAHLLKLNSNLGKAQQMAHIGSWEWDLSTNNITCSDETYRIYGLEKKTISVDEIFSYHNEEDNNTFKRMLNEAIINSIQTIEYSLRITTLQGEHKFTNSQAVISYNEEGKALNVFGIIQDVTKQKIIEQELEMAKHKAEESDMLKTSFLANMSHEIRTPMNGIIGFAEILASPETEEDKKKYYINIIIKSSYQLLSIVNDILDISRIETGQIEIKRNQIDISSLFTEIRFMHLPTATLKNNSILIKDVTSSIRYIMADESKLKQILNNLVSNALKFTNEGNVILEVELVDSMLRFCVKDSGIGIDQQDVIYIFERFKQVEQGYARKYGGTGLGLAICKGLSEAMGGKIWVESIPSVGSSFYFTLPYNATEVKLYDEGKRSNDVNKYSHKTVLLVEDEEVNMTYLKVMVKSLGLKFLTANDGIVAVTMCRDYPEIDLVLMDIKLPGIDGKEASTRIKAIRPNLPIIAQTAYALLNSKQSILDSGCDDYISKPIIKAKLIELIDKYLDK